MTEPIKYLCGDRLYLRPLEESDLERCHRWINQPDLRRFILASFPMDMKAERDWFENLPRDNPRRDIAFAIVLNEGDRHIGNTGVHGIDWFNRRGETGSFIADAADRGKGYGAEAKVLLLDYLFDTLNFHRVDSHTIEYNEASIRHLLKCGFVEEGRRRQVMFRDGKWHDARLFGILAEEWRARR